MTPIEEFLFDWKNGIKDVFRVTPEEISEYHNEDEYEDHEIKPYLQKIGIDENDYPELSKSIKYPGDY